MEATTGPLGTLPGVVGLRMRRLWRGWLAAIVPLALLVGTVGGVLADDAPTIAPFKTAHVRIEGTVSAQGQVLPVQGEGEIDATKNASRLTIAVLGATFETLVTGGRTYSRNPLSGRWEYTEGTQAGGFNPAQLAPYDPATIRAAGRNFMRVGPETIAGVPTTHWRADADLNRLIGFGGAAPGGAGQAQTAATMDLWIGDADQYLHRLRVATPDGGAGPSATATPGAPVAAGQTLTLTFDNFDAPVAIIAPAGAVPATPGATAGNAGGAFGSPVSRTPGPAVAGGNVAATRGTGTSAGPAAASSAAPASYTSPSSVLMVRILGFVSLAAVSLAGLLVLRHRRTNEQHRPRE